MGEEVVDDAGFTISAREVDPDIRLVTIAGDLDVRTVPRTTAFLTEGAALTPRHLILDLSEVTFLTSSSLPGSTVSRSGTPRNGLASSAPPKVSRRISRLRLVGTC